MMNQAKSLIFSVVCIVVWSGAARAQTKELDEYASEAWDSGRKLLSEAIELEDEKASLPRDRWFLRDKKDAEKEINDLLDEVVDVMEFSALGDSRGDYEKLREKITKANLKMAELSEDLIGAESGSTLNPFSRSFS